MKKLIIVILVVGILWNIYDAYFSGKIDCPTCNGTGGKTLSTGERLYCPRCDGKGRIKE